jgi:hypothetical protein
MIITRPTFIKKRQMIINTPAFKHVNFLRKCKEKQYFCGHYILTQGVFVNPTV